ncbi:MAG: ABC transporter permease [Clostridia bacterium]
MKAFLLVWQSFKSNFKSNAFAYSMLILAVVFCTAVSGSLYREHLAEKYYEEYNEETQRYEYDVPIAKSNIDIDNFSALVKENDLQIISLYTNTEYNFMLDGNKSSHHVRITYINENVEGLKITEGRLLNETDFAEQTNNIILNKEVISNTDLKIGQLINLGKNEYKIVGFYDSAGSSEGYVALNKNMAKESGIRFSVNKEMDLLQISNLLKKVGISKGYIIAPLAFFTFLMIVILTNIITFLLYTVICKDNGKKYNMYKLFGVKNWQLSVVMIIENIVIILAGFAIGFAIEYCVLTKLMPTDGYVSYKGLDIFVFAVWLIACTLAANIYTIIKTVKSKKIVGKGA